MTVPAVSVSNLSKVYQLYERPLDRLRELLSPTRHRYSREAWALRDVSFEVPKGATLGIVGANGAGKSTLLKILANRLTPTSGEVKIDGMVNGILELGTGLQPLLTGRQNARVNALFMGLDPWKIEEQIERIIAFSELGSKIDQPLDTYSSGMRARLAFSVLVAIQPDVLVLDEALATGDSGFAEKCTRFVRSLCSSGCTTIVVSHDIGFMRSACQSLIWIDKGEVRDQGSPDRVAANYLDSFGERLDSSTRPRFLLFKVSPAEQANELEYSLHCIAWLCPAERAAEVPDANAMVDGEHAMLQTHFLGFDNELRESLASSLLTGVTQRAAADVWGESKTLPNIPGPFRPFRPTRGPGGVGYFTLPVPQGPLPLPTGLRVFGENNLSVPLELSVQVDGRFESLGQFGTPELARKWHSYDFASPIFDLEPLLARFSGSEPAS